MKILKKENRTKEIILLIVLVILFNFVVPNYAQADLGGILFNPFAQLISGIGDAIIKVLEKTFVAKDYETTNTLYGETNHYDENVFYSPAVIFANKVPLLRINFITTEEHDNETFVYKNEYSDYGDLGLYIEIEADTKNLKIIGYEGTDGVLLPINDDAKKTGTKVEQTISWDTCYCKDGIVKYEDNDVIGQENFALGYYYFHLFIPLEKNIKLPGLSKEVSEISTGYTRECWTFKSRKEERHDVNQSTFAMYYVDFAIRYY